MLYVFSMISLQRTELGASLILGFRTTQKTSNLGFPEQQIRTGQRAMGFYPNMDTSILGVSIDLCRKFVSRLSSA